MGNRMKLLSKIANFVREKKRVPLVVVSIKFGYSYNYFKYVVVKELLELFRDLSIVRENGKEYIVVRE